MEHIYTLSYVYAQRQPLLHQMKNDEEMEYLLNLSPHGKSK